MRKTYFRLIAISLAAVLAYLNQGETHSVSAATKACGSVINYPDGLDIINVRASGVQCSTARRLIDAAFFEGNWPYPASKWKYAGWSWSQRQNGQDAMSMRVTGTKGSMTITGIRIAY